MLKADDTGCKRPPKKPIAIVVCSGAKLCECSLCIHYRPHVYLGPDDRWCYCSRDECLHARLQVECLPFTTPAKGRDYAGDGSK